MNRVLLPPTRRIFYARISNLHTSASFSMNRQNRPKNRQPRPERQNGQNRPSRGGGRGGRGGRAPATPQQATGTVPTERQVVPGAAVFIVLKEDQPTGRETRGVVRDVLTRGNHPRGIKVRLGDGQVGRVQRLDASGEGGAAAMGGAGGSSSAAGFTSRYTDVRYDDEFPDGPPARSLADFMPQVEEAEVEGERERRDVTGVEAVKCPFCEGFEGDEVAVTHHIDREHLT